MLSGPSRRLPPLSADAGPASAPARSRPARQTLALPVSPVVPVASAAPTPPTRPLTSPSRRTPRANMRTQATTRRRRVWPRLALWALIPFALLFVVLVPPQSLRATLVTLLIIAALGLVVWRLPMGDEE